MEIMKTLPGLAQDGTVRLGLIRKPTSMTGMETITVIAMIEMMIGIAVIVMIVGTTTTMTTITIGIKK